MSLIGDAATSYPAIALVQRSISYIIPDVTIEEMTRDDLQITDQPVEEGTAISDHSFKMPAVLQMKIGFSDCTGASEGYAKQKYTDLLQLQLTRQPFEVQTGKRNFTSMLLGGVVLVTDNSSEYSANIECQLREIIIVRRQSSGGSGSTADPSTGTDDAVAAGGDDGAGPGTADPVDTGTAQPGEDAGGGDGGRPLTVPVGDISPAASPEAVATATPIGDGTSPAFVQASGGDAVATPGDGLNAGTGYSGQISGQADGAPIQQQLGDTGQFGVHAFGN